MLFKCTFTVYVPIPPEDVPLDDDYLCFIDSYVAKEAWKTLTEDLDFECEYEEHFEAESMNITQQVRRCVN